MTTLPALVAFDLDDTLAPSKTAMDATMAALLAGLLDRTDVAVISGGQFGQFRSQVVEPLSRTGTSRLDRLHLLPACGTQYYRHGAEGWHRVYVEALDDAQKSAATSALVEESRRLGLWEERTWGPVIEDRESQVTFSALGQAAPIHAKESWDPGGTKKAALRAAVAPRVPGLEVRVGGTTSIDVTREGRDKAFGMGRLLAATGLQVADVLFFGDQLGPGGNDRPVQDMGVRTVAVTGWDDTAQHLRALLDD